MLHSLFKRFRPFQGPALALCCIASVLLAVLTGLSAATRVVTVTDGGQVLQVYTMRGDLESVLEKAGVTLGADDEVICSGNTVSVRRAFSVTVDAGGISRTLTVTGGTVSDALVLAGFRLGEEDALNYAPSCALEPNMRILCSDVDYATVFEDVAGGAAGEGVTRLTYRQKLVNGSVVSMELVGETVLPSAEPESAADSAPASGAPAASAVPNASADSAKVAETAAAPAQPELKPAVVQNSSGISCVSTLTPPEPIELDENGVQLHYTQLLTGSATAYTHTGSNTSTGKKPQPGYIAVNPKQIPYGTRMFIRTKDGSCIYGYAVAADTGGFIKSGRTIADLFFDTYAECIQFGRRDVEIYLLP